MYFLYILVFFPSKNLWHIKKTKFYLRIRFIRLLVCTLKHSFLIPAKASNSFSNKLTGHLSQVQNSMPGYNIYFPVTCSLFLWTFISCTCQQSISAGSDYIPQYTVFRFTSRYGVTFATIIVTVNTFLWCASMDFVIDIIIWSVGPTKCSVFSIARTPRDKLQNYITILIAHMVKKRY